MSKQVLGKKMKVVVATCDKNSWLLNTFFHFFDKFWSDCPFRKEIITETKPDNFPNTFVFQAGKLAWSDMMIKYLKERQSIWIILLLEDYLLRSPVDMNRIAQVLSVLDEDVGCVRLNERDKYAEGYSRIASQTGFREYPLCAPYSLSLQASIWKCSYLLGLLEEGESPWQTEKRGSMRTGQFEQRVLWVNEPILDYELGGCLKKGTMIPKMEKWIRENW